MVEKRLFFKIEDRVYTLPVISILEIVKLTPLSWIPNVPDYMLGLMNIRGYIIPVIDGGLLLGFKNVKSSEESMIIILETIIDGEKNSVGIIVDSIMMISKIKMSELQPREKLAGRKLHSSIIGISNLNKKSVMHMDSNILLKQLQKSTM